MEKLESAIKHFEALQRRYTKQHNGTQCEHVETALSAMRNEQNHRVQQWVKCSERLPDVFGKYLICENGDVAHARWSEEYIDFDRTIKKAFWTRDGYQRFPTHWMPLPEPPEETLPFTEE